MAQVDSARVDRGLVAWGRAIGVALPALVGLCGSALASSPSTPEAACPAKVRVGILDYELPPLVLSAARALETTGSSQPQGLAVDWLRQAARQTGCRSELQLVYLPPKRGRVELAADRIDLWAVAVPTPDGGPGHWDAGLAYFDASYGLYALSGESRFTWDGQALTGPLSEAIEVGPAQAVQQFARTHGWSVHLALDSSKALDMLLHERIRLAILPDDLVRNQSAPSQARLQRLGPTLLTVGYVSIASPDFFQGYPDFTRNLWLQLCRVGRAGMPARAGAGCREPEARR